MTVLYLLGGLLAALAFYLACAHQRLRPSLRAHARGLRVAGWLLCAACLGLAIAVLGPWAGAFAAVSAVMLGLVALPYLDAWRQARKVAP